ncbi:hypothetical protein BDM02DRAFT_3192673 [Thelephora ganbajun]|uniref:Uncharacterized protein n=1 Tax=Thelephora ganbajun TaxID=370292 RepID=A0ACB6YZZ0_THEGA|nr:hypothetical protein BDM02DRAFT_3192673 [Thelephora ganbajun]
MSFQHNKVFVSSRNQNITHYVVGSDQDQNTLDANHPEELVNAVLASEGWEMPCRVFQSYGSFNDQMWQQCISSLRNIDENRRNRPMYDDKEVLFRLIKRGIVDLDSFDDVAVGSIIRYTAVVGERLWCLLESQQAMIAKVERDFYSAMADNHVLSGRIFRLEDRLAEMERKFTSPPKEASAVSCDPSSSHTVEDSTPVIHQSAWVGLFVDMPLSALEGRKRRQRERLQRAREAKASKHPVTPPVDTDLEDITAHLSKVSLCLQR